MSIDIEDVRVVYVGTIGLDGDSADAVRMSAIEADHAALLAAVTAGHSLGSHNDTDFSGVADGQVPLWDSAANGGAGGWVAGDASGAISAVQNNAIDLMTDVHTLNAELGLEFYDRGIVPGEAAIRVKYGGTGTSTSVSRADHTHLQAIEFPYPFSASGNLSSGFREVVVGNPTINNGVPFLVKAKLRVTLRGGGGGASYYTIALNLGGTVFTSEQLYCVGGVPQPQHFQRSKQVIGDGTAMTIAAAINYVSGDPTDIRAGELIVTLLPAK